MAQIHDCNQHQDSCQSSEKRGIPTAAEAYIQHGAKDYGPEIRRQGHRCDGGDSRLRYMVRRQHLGYREKGDAAVEPKGSIREAHEPSRRNRAIRFHMGPLSRCGAPRRAARRHWAEGLDYRGEGGLDRKCVSCRRVMSFHASLLARRRLKSTGAKARIFVGFYGPTEVVP